MIYRRCRHEECCRRLVTCALSCFLLRRDTNLGCMVVQMLKCPWWIHGCLFAYCPLLSGRINIQVGIKFLMLVFVPLLFLETFLHQTTKITSNSWILYVLYTKTFYIIVGFIILMSLHYNIPVPHILLYWDRIKAFLTSWLYPYIWKNQVLSFIVKQECQRKRFFLKLYEPCIILQYVYKPTRCTKFCD